MTVETPFSRRISISCALWRGLRRRCPNCGIGAFRRGYLQVTPHCAVCGEALGHIRADDGPAYFTLLLAVHIVVPVALWVEQVWAPPLIYFTPAAMAAVVVLIGVLLPSVKGAVVALMWRLRLQGDERHDTLA